MNKFNDLIGKKFGRLTVIKRLGKNKANNIQWLCKCDCGNEKILTTAELNRGRTQSCGCLAKDLLIERNKKHGLTKTRLYSIYCGMKTRCLNKNAPAYKYYGERGISICDEWLDDFKNFYDWAKTNGYKRNLTLDRKDNNGNYNPLNCHWVTYAAQAQNRREHKLNPRNSKGQFTKQIEVKI